MEYTNGDWEASRTLNVTGTLVSYITCGEKTIAQTRLNGQESSKEENDGNACLIAMVPVMYETLQVIAKAEGPYSKDRLTHAENTIAAMQNLALAALSLIEEEAYSIREDREELKTQ